MSYIPNMTLKKRGRPTGSINKTTKEPKDVLAPNKRGRPVGSKNKTTRTEQTGDSINEKIELLNLRVEKLEEIISGLSPYEGGGRKKSK